MNESKSQKLLLLGIIGLLIVGTGIIIYALVRLQSVIP
jgi:hypothetical protein